METQSSGPARQMLAMVISRLQEPGLLLALLLGGPVLVFVYVLSYIACLHAHSVDGVKVPRGNFWLFPLLGETISALATPKLFHLEQTRKYGATFTTHIAGDPTIMTSDVDLTKWVYQKTNKLFSVAMPKSTCNLLGKGSIFFMNDADRKHLRKLMAVPLSAPRLAAFIPTVDKIASEFMASWKTQQSCKVVFYDEAKKYVLYLAWAYLITVDTQEYPFLDTMLEGFHGATRIEKLVQLYYEIEAGILTLPLYIPGTAYYKAMNARRKFEQVMTKVIADRRTGAVQCQDLLQAMLVPLEDGSLLTDAQVMDNVFTILGAAESTTSTCLVWMVKWIHENPQLHQDLQVELGAVKKSKAECEQLTYEDLKKMNLTLWTMNETLRLAQVSGFFVGRFADQDIHFKDIVIPKNWKIALTDGYHLDPIYYPEPEKFNPYRFQVMPALNTFTPFGGGATICPGDKLAKIEILTFVYHMITTYSWEVAECDKGTIWHIFPYPKNKLPIKVTPRPT